MTSPSLFPSPIPYRRRRCAKLYNSDLNIMICHDIPRVFRQTANLCETGCLGAHLTHKGSWTVNASPRCRCKSCLPGINWREAFRQRSLGRWTWLSLNASPALTSNECNLWNTFETSRKHIQIVFAWNYFVFDLPWFILSPGGNLPMGAWASQLTEQD